MKVYLERHPAKLVSPDEAPAERLARLLREAGSVSAAARRCGVSRPTVYRWMRRYGIEVERRPQVT